MQDKHFDPRYLVTLDEIYHSHWAARKRRRIGFLKEAVAHFWPEGHPSRLIQVTGTNGKGSVSHYLTQGLQAVGNTGSWTGPHVFDYAERFHINNCMVKAEEIAAIYHALLAPYQLVFMERHPGESLSFAEMGILLALHLFQRHQVVWGVMEVGAGGRYTPLMALNMEACVLTNIGDDHPKTLGSEVWQRALEKAGIARPDIPFFTSAEGESLFYVCETAKAEGAPVYVVADQDLAAVELPDAPGFRQRNLALACRIIAHFYPDRSWRELVAAMRVHLPGRFATLSDRVILDVAHNPDKMARFAEQLQHSRPGAKFRFLVGLTRSRDVRTVFAPILPLATEIIVTSASYAGQNPAKLAANLSQDFAAVSVRPDPREAYTYALATLEEGEMLVLTGSAYMIDQAVNPNPYVRHINANYGWRAGGKDLPEDKR